jgi:glutamate-1-semialdehyde 2,1-aminomutase
VPFNDEAAVRAAFAANAGAMAGIIVEPVPGNAGLYLPKPGFLEFLRKICTENGALLIFDEVMTGFRLARGGAQEIYGITPDLTCFGKIIGGGLPVGAFGGRAEIMDCLAPLGPVYQAGTLSGNPLAMAAGIACLNELGIADCGLRIEDSLPSAFPRGQQPPPPGEGEKVARSNHVYAQLEEIGAQLEAGMKAAAKAVNVPVQFKRIGSMFCGYFTSEPVHNLADAMHSDRTKFAKYFHGMLAEGIYLAPSQFEAGFISAAHMAADIEKTVSAAAKVMKGL